MSKRDKKGKVLKDMAKRLSGLKIECKPSTILLLASSLTLFMLIILQVSHCVENKKNFIVFLDKFEHQLE